MRGRIIWPATRQLCVCRATRPTSILSVDKFKLCLCLVFRPLEILLLFFSFPWTVTKNWVEANEVDIIYFMVSSLVTPAVDGWTPIYPHLAVINVNGLVSVGVCEKTPASLPLTVSITPTTLAHQQHLGPICRFPSTLLARLNDPLCDFA